MERLANGFSLPRENVQQARLVVFITALLCSDVEQTITLSRASWLPHRTFRKSYYAGSTHFFDIGNGNCLAFFDMPGLGLGDYQEVLGGHHHLAISMTPNEWNAT